MENLIQIKHPYGVLEGMLKIPQGATSLVLFAHGSGSSRFSPRNNFVADALNQAGFATLLIDLLSSSEDLDYRVRFDIGLLSQRLGVVIDWLSIAPETKNLALHLFGGSTGAAAALSVAAAKPEAVRSVVSRGGRPDLAEGVLGLVAAPTLLIVGGSDFGVIELNQEAYRKLNCTKALELVAGATHLFEEPGCLEEVARLAREWFIRYQNSDHQNLQGRE